VRRVGFELGAESRPHFRFLGDREPPVHEKQDREHHERQQRRPFQQEAQQAEVALGRRTRSSSSASWGDQPVNVRTRDVLRGRMKRHRQHSDTSEFTARPPPEGCHR
jgi:hypothetical protein